MYLIFYSKFTNLMSICYILCNSTYMYTNLKRIKLIPSNCQVGTETNPSLYKLWEFFALLFSGGAFPCLKYPAMHAQISIQPKAWIDSSSDLRNWRLLSPCTFSLVFCFENYSSWTPQTLRSVFSTSWDLWNLIHHPVVPWKLPPGSKLGQRKGSSYFYSFYQEYMPCSVICPICENWYFSMMIWMHLSKPL